MSNGRLSTEYSQHYQLPFFAVWFHAAKKGVNYYMGDFMWDYVIEVFVRVVVQ